MSRIWLRAALLMFLLITCACGAGTPTSPQAGLGGTSWQLVKFQSGDGRTLTPDDKAKFEIFLENNRSAIAKDLDGAPVYLAKNAWDVGYVSEKTRANGFTKTKEGA